jgi:hypothetical protein
VDRRLTWLDRRIDGTDGRLLLQDGTVLASGDRWYLAYTVTHLEHESQPAAEPRRPIGVWDPVLTLHGARPTAHCHAAVESAAPLLFDGLRADGERRYQVRVAMQWRAEGRWTLTVLEDLDLYD